MTRPGGWALIAFVPATDLDRARAFYEGTMGLTLVDQHDFACVFDAFGTMLRVTKVAEAPRLGYTVLGWAVPDIEAAVRELGAAGVTFVRYDGVAQDEHGVWTTPSGERVAWFKDPDGNTLSIAQFG